ncbi:hypothetical protein [Amycolatopsis saalfeldensis]|uniref:hypothetical protein n=1 Tax=Amycolatopsis saalfeldensis TaxID=394193 RepID=UPI0011607D5E|nr:hypothetical protein [Amycolatopsis saalfeldensis]
MSLSAATGIAAASPLPPLKIRNGVLTVCLNAAAQRAFTADGLRMAAIAPATQSTTADGRSCVKFAVVGESNLDITEAHATLPGGFDFGNAAGRHLTLTGLDVRTRGLTLVATAKVDNRPSPVDVFYVNVLQAGIQPQVLPLGVKLAAQCMLTGQLAGAMKTDLGAAPLAGDTAMLAATGSADLGPSLLPDSAGQAG